MKQYRRERVANAIREIVSDGIARRLSDPRIAPLTTISRVEVGPDLLTATVYVTVPTGEADERKTISAMKSARGYLQRMVAKELNLRQCPELRMELDEQQKMVLQTLEQIEANRRERGEDDPQDSETTGERADPDDTTDPNPDHNSNSNSGPNVVDSGSDEVDA
jgi:ribosome-binding factor A